MSKSLNFCIIKELLPFVILNFCPEHNINTIRDTNLPPFTNKRLFGAHSSVLPILLFFFSESSPDAYQLE